MSFSNVPFQSLDDLGMKDMRDCFIRGHMLRMLFTLALLRSSSHDALDQSL